MRQALDLAPLPGPLAFQPVPSFSCIVVDVVGVAHLHPAVSAGPELPFRALGFF
jgi:hypothetical protein